MHSITLEATERVARSMSEGAGEFTVVLAHAAADAAAAASVAHELCARGQDVVEVIVTDGDAPVDGPIMEACAKLGGRGLFVIARGAALGAERAEVLRAVLRDLGVPMSRSLALGMGGIPAGVFADRVTSVGRRITVRDATGRVTGHLPPSTVAADASAAVRGYAVVPPNFESAEGLASPATAPGIAGAHAAAVAVGLGDASPAPRRRHAMIGAAVLAAAAAALLVLVPRHPTADAAPADAGTVPSPTDAAAVDPPADLPPPLAAAAAMEPSPAPTLPVEDSAAIVAALRSREIRALDVFVVAAEAKKPADFAGATAYCAALTVAGISDWRLPEIGELMSMSRAKMVRKGSFWSLTKGDTFGDLRLVLVIKRDRISAIPSGWDGGRVICVRERA